MPKIVKIIEVNYESGDFVVRVSPKQIKLLPQETQEHLKTANKEMLLAFKSCLDSALSLLERPKKPDNAATRRTYIRVEDAEEEATA